MAQKVSVIICENCNATVPAYKSGRKRTRFCSCKCSRQHYGRSINKGYVKINCIICNSEFTRKHSKHKFYLKRSKEQKIGSGLFCSGHCAALSNPRVGVFGFKVSSSKSIERAYKLTSQFFNRNGMGNLKNQNESLLKMVFAVGLAKQKLKGETTPCLK